MATVTEGTGSAYVYEVVVDGIARYIGKGRGRRATSHVLIAKRLIRHSNVGRKVRRSRFYRSLAEAIVAGAAVEVRYAAQMLTDEVAFELEREMILAAPFGQLWNSAPGGEGQDGEYLRSFYTPERREYHRQVAQRSWAEDASRRQARFAEAGSREAQSDMLKAKWADPEYRAMQRAARAKPRPTRCGVPVPALSAPAKTRWADPAFRKRAIEGMKCAAAQQDPERRRAAVEKLAVIRSSPEYRAKLSASLRAAHARRRAAKQTAP